MSRPKHIVALRFSALGDVAMTVPVIRLLLLQNPELKITFVSVPFHKPLFDGIERLQFYGVNLKTDYKGIAGLYKLAQKLNNDIGFDAVADLHDVLRTKIIRLFLKSRRIKIIDKGRGEKKELTRKKNKKLRQLKSTHQRYADVFKALGYPVDLDFKLGLSPKTKLTTVDNKRFKIGIAPFAMHNAKMYPLDKMKLLVHKLSNLENATIYLFGSKKEATLMDEWTSGNTNVELVAGKFNFSDELQLISNMNIMVTMDSANMHLASLFGVPVVSIWGGTHPYLGFYGWGQDIGNAVQENLPCRPSSVFGSKDCPIHGSEGCMQHITPEQIVEKVIKVLNRQN